MTDADAAWTSRRDELLARVVRRGRARRRRRAFAVTGTTAALIVALVTGLYFPHRGTRSSLHVANTVPASTTTTVQPSRPAGVLLVGDAVMLGARAALEHAIPGARVDAEISRQFGNAVSVLEADKRDGGWPRTVVIDLGDNGPSGADATDQTTALFKQIMETVGPDSTVFFLDLKLPRAWESAVNAGLYAAAPQWPNAHVLDWKIGSDLHPDWFTADGFHLSTAGQVGYAEFVREGIRGLDATNADPFAGAAIPSSGLAVLDDPKVIAPEHPGSWTIELLDDAGQEAGLLPRAVVDDDTLNAPWHELVATDAGLRVAPRPLEPGTDVPAGCTQTEHTPALAVAICGARTGEQLLGDRIVVNRGAGWTQLIAAPPAPPGVTHVGGHWAWAAPSPDGQWVLAGWSGECEVPTSLFVSVADGSVRAVTGETGAAWASAPDSTNLGWTADGSAMAIFGGESGCGTAAAVPRGVYLVSPRDGSRPLLLLLSPNQQVLRWSAVDDRRTLPQVAGSPLSVDLDGDGRPDRLRITPDAIGAVAPSRMTATLADGRVVSGPLPSGYSEHVLGTADIAGDGRHEVLMTVGGETAENGAIIVLDGDHLVAITTNPDGLPLSWGVHSNADPWGTIDLSCRDVDGQASLLATSSTRASSIDPVRRWQRSVFALEGAKLVLRKRDSGTLAMTATPPPDLPLANVVSCGTAQLPDPTAG